MGGGGEITINVDDPALDRELAVTMRRVLDGETTQQDAEWLSNLIAWMRAKIRVYQLGDDRDNEYVVEANG